MKLIAFLDIVKNLVQIFKDIQVTNIEYDRQVTKTLSSGIKYIFEIDQERINLEVLVSVGFHRIININNWQGYGFITSLRNDSELIINTKYAKNNYGIHRETYKKKGIKSVDSDTVPQLPFNQCFDEDVLEPLMFQLLTKYTINEVQSMIAVSYLCQDIEMCYELLPMISLDLTALSFLSEDDIMELSTSIKDTYENIKIDSIV